MNRCCHHKRFCNMKDFEEAVRHDAHCKCSSECRRDEHEHHGHGNCEFEVKCCCLGKHVCVKANPKKCSLNLEIEKRHNPHDGKKHEGKKKEDC